MDTLLIKWHEASDLIWGYSKRKLFEQVKAVAFIVLYLIFFQVAVLKLPIYDFGVIAVGLILVVFGLTFFMEGLTLGIMPIGESLGLKLPGKVTLFGILIFAFILGLGATLAEPAIGVLRAMGASVNAREAPLLHYILSQKPVSLVGSVGIGVGLAVIFGVLRFLFNWSLKPLIYPLVLISLGLSSFALFEPQFKQILGLAWDCGAVTTGPVTVPLVIALGLGISRVVTGHTEEGASSGFGVVTLASLFPIISVLLLSLYYFHSADFNQQMKKNSSISTESVVIKAPLEQQHDKKSYTTTIKESAIISAQAILPLCLFMILIFRLILKEKFTYLDEISMGLFLALIGMTLFYLGIDLGLGKLGKQVGGVLPATYSSIHLTSETKVIKNFDPSHVQTKYTSNGNIQHFFYLFQNNKTYTIPYDQSNYHPEKKIYEYIPKHGPIWGDDSFSALGIMITLIFAFFMGYGATLAEPALNALGSTVENISVGTFKKSLLMQTVAVGVGVGIALGVTKIMWDLPLFWMLAPPYLILLILSYFSTEEFVNIAWDSAGVTTGPITVPLVLAMGLGIGNQSAAIEGFGILAMASVCPIMSVLIMGIFVMQNRQSVLIDEDFEKVEEEA